VVPFPFTGLLSEFFIGGDEVEGGSGNRSVPGSWRFWVCGCSLRFYEFSMGFNPT
jgi:hypothetical protein